MPKPRPLPLKLLPLPPAAIAPPKTAKGAFSRKLPKPLPPAACKLSLQTAQTAAACPLQTAQTAANFPLPPAPCKLPKPPANCPNQPCLPLPCRFIRTSLRRIRPENRTAPTPLPTV